tara:strand:- start:262 stop:837 length:576 start_codon:yes stop_codon:yes gene_type:complete
MQYVILAAGMGTRLSPLTNDRIHKCLFEYQGKPLISHFLEKLTQQDNITIVVGHLKEQVIEKITSNFPNLNISFIENPDYKTTGTSHSLWLAKEHAKEGFIYANADLVPDPRFFEDLKKEGNIIFVDKNDLFRNNLIKFSKQTTQELFNLPHRKEESAYDRIFKIIGHNHFHHIDISNYKWKEIDEPTDLK